MNEKIIATGIIALAGIGITFARRYNNPDDKAAGIGVAGWTMVIFLLMWA